MQMKGLGMQEELGLVYGRVLTLQSSKSAGHRKTHKRLKRVGKSAFLACCQAGI